jgi:hypothetical protein
MSSSCTSPLNFETESYSSSTGALVDWVNVPTMQASQVIYACYGNSSISTDQSNPAGTWNGNYAAVYHFAESSFNNYGTIHDSTANADNGTIETALYSTTSSGQIDGALNAGALNTVATVNLGSTITLSGAWTVSFWQQIPASFGTGNGATIAGNASTYPMYFYNGNLYVNGGGGYGDISYGTVNAGSWYYWTVTSNSAQTTATAYKNGSSLGTISYGGSPSVNAMLNYAQSGSGDGYSIGGTVDELRIAQTNFPSSWILTEYNNQSSPSTFYTLGSEV